MEHDPDPGSDLDLELELEAAYGDRMREFAERLLRFDTTGGNERPAQEWIRERLEEWGFETYAWTADAAQLAGHPSFPPAEELDVEDRPSVAGVLEFGDPDHETAKTLVLNGHVDVVPAEADHWTGDPFEPRWEGDRLVARGAADMKSQLAACVFAARALRDCVESDSAVDADREPNGRLVVESVVGEEEGGVGAAAAALSNPYPFERDAAIVVEPTDSRVVTATEGCLMGRVRIDGRSAHAARRWEGESVLPHFERVRRTLGELERERAERVVHPLYDRFDVPWPIVVGRVEAGTWASNVPATLAAEIRVGVAPGETVDDVEEECRERLEAVAAERDSPADGPTFERFGIQFESAEIDPDEPVVSELRAAMVERGFSASDASPVGETYGSDARHYIGAGIPTVVFGPGRIGVAHFPDESIHWPDVVNAGEVLAETARRFLGS